MYLSVLVKEVILAHAGLIKQIINNIMFYIIIIIMLLFLIYVDVVCDVS